MAGTSSRRAKLPRVWLFTDERLGGVCPHDLLWQAVGRLPRGAGIVFRHYGWSERARDMLLQRLAKVARARHLMLVASRMPQMRGIAGRHRQARGERRTGGRFITASAHDQRELRAGFAAGAALVFLSPVFTTASHPDAVPMGPVRFGLQARGAPGPIVGLGGMTARRAVRMKALGAHGYAAIGDWL